MTLTFLVSAAWAAPAHSSIGRGLAALSGWLGAGFEQALTRISSAITEPVGLVFMGVGLIALSFVVRRGVSKRRH